MVRTYLNETQLKLVQLYLDKYPDVEDLLLEKYQSFLIQELPAREFDSIVEDINKFISLGSSF
jgi:hypothetical protein